MNKEWFLEAHEVLDGFIALDAIADVLDDSINIATRQSDDPRNSDIELTLPFEDACTLYDYIKETGHFSK